MDGRQIPGLKDERRVLACWRVQDLESPLAGSQRGHYCQECQAEVWVMHRNLGFRLDILCRPCGLSEATKFPNPKVFPASVLQGRN